MGKSFIARALRLLDRSAISSVDQSRIPDLLVSEEAPNGQGNFSLYEGDVCIGSFELDTNAKTVRLSQPQYIFHVLMCTGKSGHEILLNGESKHGKKTQYRVQK